MVTAQGLGCIFRMVRKIGWSKVILQRTLSVQYAFALTLELANTPHTSWRTFCLSQDGSPNSQVRGKTVAIIGQGQNGLIAARVMRMMGAAQVQR